VKFEFTHHDHHAQIALGVRRADDFIDPEVKALAAHVDAVIVMAGYDPSIESEGFDRTFKLPSDQDELIRSVRDVNNNTIVTVTSGGGVDMRSFVERIPAIIQTWYAGQEGGTALAKLIFGEVNPSGKLPVSFERAWEDSAVVHSYFPDAQKHIAYTEGVFLGYRHFDKGPKRPLFAFGHGLSYTQFQFDNLEIVPELGDLRGNVVVSFDVSNVGYRAGAEVAQIYVGENNPRLPRPRKELKGFAKELLAPNETKRMSVTLSQRDFSYFDASCQQWKADPGDFTISVGSASDAIKLQGKFTLR